MDADSIALDLLRRARLDVGEPLSLRAIAAALGLTLVRARGLGMHGTAVPGVIVYDGTMRSLAHELAHHAVAMAGFGTPHDERLVAAVGARLVTPPQAFRRAIKWGADRARLATTFSVSETCAALRIGELTGEPIAVITRSRVLAAGEWPWPAEDVLRRMVRQRQSGLIIERCGDDSRRLIVRAA
jgi:hypothetical protein